MGTIHDRVSGARSEIGAGVVKPNTRTDFVACNDDDADASARDPQNDSRPYLTRFGEQLPLPFATGPVGKRVFVLSTDRLHGNRLQKVIEELRPETAIDLRQLIRFDFPGTNRKQIFNYFHACRTHYVRDPLSWGEIDARSMRDIRGAISQVLLHEVIERDVPSVMILVPKSEDARLIASHLNVLLTQRSPTPWILEFQ